MSIFSYFSIDPQQKDTRTELTDLLFQNFQIEELKENNQYYCEKCAKNSNLSLKKL